MVLQLLRQSWLGEVPQQSRATTDYTCECKEPTTVAANYEKDAFISYNRADKV
ncbi:MAG: hypothetical protein M3347_05400 [Armatimonadota bacterium]|nr:hypothetical protein [Armatimonadota bacterium]